MKTKMLITFFMVALVWTVSAQTSIVGRWEVADDPGQSKLEFKNDQTMVMSDSENEMLFTYEVNYSSSPVKIALTLSEDENVKMYAILEFISDNQAHFCLNMDGTDYPDAFESTEFNQSVIINKVE